MSAEICPVNDLERLARSPRRPELPEIGIDDAER